MTAAQIHLFLSRSPLLFLLAALILFGLAWKKKQADWETISLVWTIVACILVIPTYLSGSFIETSFASEHDKSAKISLVLSILTSVLLIISVTFRQNPVSHWTKSLGLISALLTLISMGLTNHYGSLIRHGEPNAISDEEDSSEQEAEGEQDDEEDQEDREDPQRGNEV
jgi:lipid-A-disaccharide synthase-like uncharacterized protein